MLFLFFARWRKWKWHGSYNAKQIIDTIDASTSYFWHHSIFCNDHEQLCTEFCWHVNVTISETIVHCFTTWWWVVFYTFISLCHLSLLLHLQLFFLLYKTILLVREEALVVNLITTGLFIFANKIVHDVEYGNGPFVGIELSMYCIISDHCLQYMFHETASFVDLGPVNIFFREIWLGKVLFRNSLRKLSYTCVDLLFLMK